MTENQTLSTSEASDASQIVDAETADTASEVAQTNKNEKSETEEQLPDTAQISSKTSEKEQVADKSTTETKTEAEAAPSEPTAEQETQENASRSDKAPVEEEAEETAESVRGYTGTETVGKTLTLDELRELEATGDDGSGITSDRSLETLIDESLNESVEVGEIVTGKVVSLTEKEIVVDIGFKSDGVVSKSEFLEEPEIDDEIDVYIDRLEDRRGQLTLSRGKAVDLKRWRIIEEAFNTGAILEGEVVKRIKGGMIVNLLGAEAFLPGSQVDVRRVRDFEAYLNKTMEFKVVKVNPQNGNVVLSHKALVEKDLEEQRKKILDSLEVGQVLEGQVKNIVNFGAFVDLGGVDGLLHITDISWGRVSHPSEVLELDDRIKVVVLDYDKERQRISLGYKQLQEHPWDNISEKYVEGQEVNGRVVSITDYGAFIELETGIEGLVHISEMSWTEHVKHPTQKVQLGEEVTVKILGIDAEEKKISLGMKQLEPDPWEGLLERFPVGTITSGKIRNITTFGAFVELEPGIDGLVHVSDLSWTKRVKHPSEIVNKGDELEVVVLDIDVVNRRISLGHKQVQTDPWIQFEEAYEEGTEVSGTITSMNDGGVVVELPLGVEAFVPASHLERQGHPVDAYEEGEELELSILRTDRESREIVGSQTQRLHEEEQEAEREEREKRKKARKEERRAMREHRRSSSGPATLGELSGLEALRTELEESEEAEEESADEEEDKE